MLPIATQKLLPTAGFAWTLRILGFMSLATLSISIGVMRQRLPPRKRGEMFAFRALKEGPFAAYCSGMFVAMLGFYVFLQFVQDVSTPLLCSSCRLLRTGQTVRPLTNSASIQWAEATNLTSTFPSIYYLPIINAASVLGRTLPNLLADYLGPLNVQIPCAFVSALLVYVWIAIDSLPPLLVIAVLYGFWSGGMLALPPASVASLTQDLTYFGARMGLCFVGMAVGSLIGTPVTGAIVRVRGPGGNWDGARVWSGTTVLAGAVLMLLARWLVRGQAGKRWIKV